MLEQGTFCFKYIPGVYGVFKTHLIQSRKEGGNALCLTGKQDTRTLPQNFAENDTGDNRITGEMPLQEKFIPSDGFFCRKPCPLSALLHQSEACDLYGAGFF